MKSRCLSENQSKDYPKNRWSKFFRNIKYANFAIINSTEMIT